jgi:hypothetical protein
MTEPETMTLVLLRGMRADRQAFRDEVRADFETLRRI